MKHLLILFFLLTTNAFAQGPFGDYAVVKDKDGYVNIRTKENVKSKIVGTLPNNTLVYTLFDTTYDESGEEISFNWLYVDKGYVHKSRLKKVQDFPSAGLKNKIIALPLQGKVLACPLPNSHLIKPSTRLPRKGTKSIMNLSLTESGCKDGIMMSFYRLITTKVSRSLLIVKMFLSLKMPMMICMR